MKKKTKTRRLTDRAFREVHRKLPKQVFNTFVEKGSEAAEAQRKAIALNKARRAGARIPKRRSGG